MREKFHRPVEGFAYRYEMHCHTSWCSACAHNSPQEIAQAYYSAGYAGIVITDHFLLGNSAVNRRLPWKEKMEAYWAAYEAAKSWAGKQARNFHVLFGLEHQYGGGKEVLTYGIGLDFLLAHPDLHLLPLEEYHRAVKQAGGLVVMAHPYRHASYIDDTIAPRPECLDGAEVFNAGNTEEENLQALELAREHGLLMTSGGDVHTIHDEAIGQAGVAFQTPVATGEELCAALRAGDCRLVIQGELA